MTYLAISIGAVLGANLRYLVGGWVADRLGAAFPFGTLVVNVSGSFLLGAALALVTQRSLGPWWIRPGFAIGFVGAYTTFSTFSYETLGLIEAGSLAAAGANIVASVVGSLVGVYLGSVIVRAL